MRLLTQLKPASRGMVILAGVILVTQSAVAHESVDSQALIDKYCAVCHNSEDFAGGVDLEFANATSIAERAPRSVRK